MKHLINYLRNHISIKGRLFLMFLVPGAIYYLVSTFISFSHIQSVSNARMEQLQVVVESAVGKTASQSLSRGLEKELKEVIKSLVSDTDISGIAIYDIDGNIFTKAGDLRIHSRITKYEKELFHIPVVPDFDEISFDEGVSEGKPELIGKLVFYVDREKISGQSWQAVLSDFLVFTIILFICSPFFYALYQSFSRPLSSILNDILEFEKGNLDWTQRTTIGDDEFSRVKHALRRLAKTQVDQSRQILDGKKALEMRAKELEKQVAIATEARESADRANAQKDTFVANVSHEMRTPLAGVVSGTDLVEQYITSALAQIMESKDKLSPEQFAYLYSIRANLRKALDGIDIAKQSSGQLTRMVNDLLASIQDMYHDIILRPSTFVLYDSIDVLLRSHHDQAKAKGLEYSCTIQGIDVESPSYVKGDWIRLSQVVNNLIDNAIRFTEQGKILVSVNAMQSTDGVTLDFSVTDTGVGIVDHEKESIFKLFHIGENPSDKKYAGLGTGLTIANRISDRMKGELNLEHSELGKGSRFSFRITLSQSSAEAMVPQETIAAPGRKLSLLYVEDSAVNRQVFKMYCELTNIDLLVASNGREGLDRYNSHHFDALVVDCHMPGMNGYEFVRHVRKSETDSDSGRIPIFALSADASTRNREQCFDAGFDEFLTKPYTEASFKFILDRIDRLNKKNQRS